MTPDGHKAKAEALAVGAADMLTTLAIPEGAPIPPRWHHGLEYAKALTGLAAVHATLAGVGDPR